MQSSNKININYSSLTGLRAELLRKQAEVDEARARNQGNQLRAEPKVKVKKVHEKNKKNSSTEATDIDDLKMHTKSKLMLEAKSRLYDNLKKSHNNMNPNFLVDFENKSDSEEEKETRKEDKKESDSDLDFDDDDDDWIEYVDCFGRTRKCLKEDLPAMKEKDKLLGREVLRNSEPDEAETEKREPSTAESPVREPGLEQMRKKWEAQMEKLANKADIHYQDVLFDEARSHGVGYYAFSQDEEERKKQQENLKTLRKETEMKQKQAQEVREKKLLIERNRLKAAKVRQKIRAGLSGELTEEEIREIDVKYSLIDSTRTHEKGSEEEKQEIKEESQENHNRGDEATKTKSLESVEDKIKAFGELLGKRNKWYTMSQEEWVEKRRKIRPEEFAPCYDNFVKEERNVEASKKDISEEREDVVKPLLNKQNCEESSAKGRKRVSFDKEEDVIGPLPFEANTTESDMIKTEENNFDDEKNFTGPLSPEENTKQNNVEKKIETDDEILAGLRYWRAKVEERQRQCSEQ